MSFEPREYLRHILAEADYLATTSAGLSRERFQQDPTLQRAFVRSLEIIGEAAKKVPSDIRAQHPSKEPISLRVDTDILAWYRAQGPRYQSRMNAVLRAYMVAMQQKGASRPARKRRAAK